MIWDIIQNKLEMADIAHGGVDLFYEEMSADVVRGVMLKTPLTGVLIDPHIPGYHKPTLQVIVRDSDPVIGANKADRISDILTVSSVENYDATASRGKVQINLFYPRSMPIRYPRSEGGSYEWSLNFITSWSIGRP